MQNVPKKSSLQGLRVALGQYDCIWEDKAANRKRVQEMLARLRGKVDVLVLPEMTLTGFSMQTKKTREPFLTSETIAWFKQQARENNVAIIFGLTVGAPADAQVKNVACAIDRRGKLIAHYEKMHPFSFGQEHRFFKAGNKIAVFKLGGVKCSMVICYDLRFPGLFEALAKQGVETVFVIANWPEKRIHHWDLLLQARALDVQSYIVGVNRIGSGGGLNYPGHSSVYDPTGKNLVKIRSKKIALCELDLKEVRTARKNFPSLRDKKFSLYPNV